MVNFSKIVSVAIACVAISVSSLANFPISKFVEEEAPGMWGKQSGFYAPLQAHCFVQAAMLVENANGVIDAVAIEQEVKTILSSLDVDNHIQKNKLDTETINRILYKFMVSIIEAKCTVVNGEKIAESDLSEEHFNLVPWVGTLSSQEMYLAKLLASPDLNRTEIGSAYKKEYGLGSINTAYGHISSVYQKVWGLKAFRQNLQHKKPKGGPSRV